MLGGLAAAGKKYENCPSIRKAVQFYLSTQNEEGGWGESLESCPIMVTIVSNFLFLINFGIYTRLLPWLDWCTQFASQWSRVVVTKSKAHPITLLGCTTTFQLKIYVGGYTTANAFIQLGLTNI